jgi:hypothetical protein
MELTFPQSQGSAKTQFLAARGGGAGQAVDFANLFNSPLRPLSCHPTVTTKVVGGGRKRCLWVRFSTVKYGVTIILVNPKLTGDDILLWDVLVSDVKGLY